MLRSTFAAFLSPLWPPHAVSVSEFDSAPSATFSCLHLKDLKEEGLETPREKEEIRTSRGRDPKSCRREVQSPLSVLESTNTSASSGCPPSTTSPPRSMWQEAIRRKRYLLDRAGASGVRDKPRAGQGQDKRNKSTDWLYESYYCMSQQHPLIVFLLLIVMGACLALLTVFFASGLVSDSNKHLWIYAV